MIRNRFHCGLIHHRCSRTGEGSTGRNHPILGGLCTGPTGAYFNSAGIDGLLGFATRQICLGIDGALAGQILALLAWFGVADDDQLGIRIVL